MITILIVSLSRSISLLIFHRKLYLEYSLFNKQFNNSCWQMLISAQQLAAEPPQSLAGPSVVISHSQQDSSATVITPLVISGESFMRQPDPSLHLQIKVRQLLIFWIDSVHICTYTIYTVYLTKFVNWNICVLGRFRTYWGMFSWGVNPILDTI